MLGLSLDIVKFPRCLQFSITSRAKLLIGCQISKLLVKWSSRYTDCWMRCPFQSWGSMIHSHWRVVGRALIKFPNRNKNTYSEAFMYMFSQYLLSASTYQTLSLTLKGLAFTIGMVSFVRWVFSLTSLVSKELHFAIKIYPIIESKKNLREIQKELDNKHNATDNMLLFQ